MSLIKIMDTTSVSVSQNATNCHDTDQNEKKYEKKIRFISYQSHELKEQIAH